MQTFLPFAGFADSARVLDDRRLGKQRVETLQILRALHFEGYGWGHHPAVLMWRWHTDALVSYGLAVVAEWVGRGRRDTVGPMIAEFGHPRPPASQAALAGRGALPAWLGWEALHRSHRSALLRKEPAHYAPRLPPDTPPDLDYVWPPPTGAEVRPGGRAHAAWVVRAEPTDAAVAIAAVPPAPARGRKTKAARQVEHFLASIRVDDLVAVPDDGRLRVGTVTGPARVEADRSVRPVRWLGHAERARLRFPAALQDPRFVFALYDEPALARWRRAREPAGDAAPGSAHPAEGGDRGGGPG